MFAVEVVKDDHFPDKAWLRVTPVSKDRGASWSSVPLFSREEIVSVIASLQEFLRTNEIESCPSCELGLCPDGAGGFIPCTICGREESVRHHLDSVQIDYDPVELIDALSMMNELESKYTDPDTRWWKLRARFAGQKYAQRTPDGLTAAQKSEVEQIVRKLITGKA